MQDLFFIATPAVGEYYFLHPRDYKEEYNSIDDFYSRRGTNGALCLEKEDADNLIEYFRNRDIVGSEKYKLINIDSIFGFLREQTESYPVEKNNWKPQKPQRYEWEGNKNEAAGQRS